MLVSHRKKFIYTKTVKTAGTSVELYFEPYCVEENTWQFSDERDACVSEFGIIGRRGKPKYKSLRGQPRDTWYNHMPANEIKSLLGTAMWEEYFKFCVVRNPYDKVVSEFFFERERYDRNLSRYSKLKNPVKKNILRKKSPFDHIQNSDVVAAFRYYVRQGGGNVDRKLYTLNQELCLDYYIRFEKLLDGVREVCMILNIPFDSQRMPKMKSGSRNRSFSASELYDAETEEIVRKKFAFELKNFGYYFPD